MPDLKHFMDTQGLPIPRCPKIFFRPMSGDTDAVFYLSGDIGVNLYRYPDMDRLLSSFNGLVVLCHELVHLHQMPDLKSQIIRRFWYKLETLLFGEATLEKEAYRMERKLALRLRSYLQEHQSNE